MLCLGWPCRFPFPQRASNLGDTHFSLAILIMTLPEATAAAWEEFWKRFYSEQHQAFQSILARNPRDLTIETYSFVRNTLDLSEEEFLVGTYRIAIEGLELYKSNNRAAVPETVRDVLRRLSPDDDGETYDRTKKVQNIRADVDGVPTRAYFIADKNLSFRHQGSEDKKPTKVFLRRLTDERLLQCKRQWQDCRACWERCISKC